MISLGMKIWIRNFADKWSCCTFDGDEMLKCSTLFLGGFTLFETLHYLAKTLVKIDMLDKIWKVHHNAYHIPACVLHQVAVGTFCIWKPFSFHNWKMKTAMTTFWYHETVPETISGTETISLDSCKNCNAKSLKPCGTLLACQFGLFMCAVSKLHIWLQVPIFTGIPQKMRSSCLCCVIVNFQFPLSLQCRSCHS